MWMVWRRRHSQPHWGWYVRYPTEEEALEAAQQFRHLTYDYDYKVEKLNEAISHQGTDRSSSGPVDGVSGGQ